MRSLSILLLLTSTIGALPTPPPSLADLESFKDVFDRQSQHLIDTAALNNAFMNNRQAQRLEALQRQNQQLAELRAALRGINDGVNSQLGANREGRSLADLLRKSVNQVLASQGGVAALSSTGLSDGGRGLEGIASGLTNTLLGQSLGVSSPGPQVPSPQSQYQPQPQYQQNPQPQYQPQYQPNPQPQYQPPYSQSQYQPNRQEAQTKAPAAPDTPGYESFRPELQYIPQPSS